VVEHKDFFHFVFYFIHYAKRDRIDLRVRDRATITSVRLDNRPTSVFRGVAFFKKCRVA